ncbi:hypothetical protein Fmac_026439 [Flemingia macrophylla]|uniref:Uncharacterized protein n=1 Tax=Flemingia macrophylla TaxID=520843 RepID=A0ABD1LEV7_9FABA
MVSQRHQSNPLTLSSWNSSSIRSHASTMITTTIGNRERDLLAGFLGQVASNFGNFPMLYENWTQDIANKNAANRANLVIPHILGSKTLARKRDKLETIHGREFSRAEMYQLSHKKPDGTFVNEEVRELHSNERMEQMQAEIESLKAQVAEIDSLKAQVVEVDVLKQQIVFLMQHAKGDETPDLESPINKRSSEGSHMLEGGNSLATI